MSPKVAILLVCFGAVAFNGANGASIDLEDTFVPAATRCGQVNDPCWNHSDCCGSLQCWQWLPFVQGSCFEPACTAVGESCQTDEECCSYPANTCVALPGGSVCN